MKVGVNLINFGPGASPQSLARWVQLAETLGYHLLMTSDHIAITPDVQSRYPAPFYEPLSTLGWLAGITQTIAIGTTVIILPYRNVLEIARVGANVDQLSGGRFILGVGVGWAQDEFEALGVPFHRRGAITDEYLDALKRLWTTDKASYEGRFVTFKDVYTAPGPVQSPHPPIWVGGASDAALRRAVRYGTAWHPIRIRWQPFKHTLLPRLNAIAEAENRPLPELCPRIRLRLTSQPMPEDERVMGEGTLDQVRRDLEALQALGCTYVLLDTYYDDVEATRHHETAWRMLATMAEKVLDLAHETLR
ncbi:MAG: LLM class F420-dependent oxidoreductase [bacterium]|nr:LLM class F420-dependent oxidoreductase [bacterium]